MKLIDFQLIILLTILAFLAICSYQDLRYRKAENKYVFPIALLCIPLILINDIGIFHIAIISLLLVFYRFNWMGGADIKVLIPLMASLPIIGILILWKVALSAYIGLVIAFIAKTRTISLKMEVPFMPSIFLGVLAYVIFLAM